MRSTKSILFLVGLINPDGLRILEQQNCGIGKNVRLIGNATEVIPGLRPWMALINNNDTSKPYYCNGTLITDQFVLTVAHCATQVELESVTLGNNNLLTDEDCFKSKNSNVINCLPSVERFGIEKVIVHEDFTFNEVYANDIALLKLSRKVKFQDHISPICLPVNATLQQQAETLATLQLTGWGDDEHDDNKKTILRETAVDTSIEGRKKCIEKIARFGPGGIYDLCVLKKPVLCFGISGAPFSSSVEYSGTQRFVQFGIINVGISDCATTAGVKVANYMPWITSCTVISIWYLVISQMKITLFFIVCNRTYIS